MSPIYHRTARRRRILDTLQPQTINGYIIPMSDLRRYLNSRRNPARHSRSTWTLDTFWVTHNGTKVQRMLDELEKGWMSAKGICSGFVQGHTLEHKQKPSCKST